MDLISRAAAIDAMGIEPFAFSEYENGLHDKWEDDVEALKDLPPAQPERKKGKWGFTDGFGNMCECSECGARIDIQEKFRSFFCYHCGADMREDVLQSAQPVLTCKGCKYDYYEYAGCRNCLRKERELYEPE